MGKYFYTAFLAVASVMEFFEIIGTPNNPLIDFFYITGFVYLILTMLTRSLPPWIWSPGFGIIGLSSLIYLILLFFGVPDRPIKVIDSSISLLVWLTCLYYLNAFQKAEKKEDNENI